MITFASTTYPVYDSKAPYTASDASSQRELAYMDYRVVPDFTTQQNDLQDVLAAI